MATVLAGVTLPEDTIWIDRDTDKKHAMKRRKALNGAMVINVLPGVSSSKTITLHCPWMRYADAVAICALMNEEPDPDAPYLWSTRGFCTTFRSIWKTKTRSNSYP